MTDKIEITATPPWSVSVNGEKIASSEAVPPEPPDPDDGTFPPLLAVGSWSVEEDERTPEVKVTFVPGAGFTMDPAFNYHFVCQEVSTDPVDPTTSTPIVSATEPTPRRGGERAPGSKIYSSVWVVSKEDKTLFQNATADGYKLEQTLVGSGIGPTPEPPDPDADWPPMPQNLIDRGVALATIKYGNSGNSSCNLSSKGTAFLAPIYAYVTGDKSSKVKDKVTSTLNALLGSNGPCGMSGPGAAQETYALAFFHLLRESDLWGGVSSANKKKIDAIFHATALIRAWEGNDSSPSAGHKTITGDSGADIKDIGPNISFSIPAGLIQCAEWFGYKELDAWLNSTSIAAVRTEVKEAFGGTSGNLYKTLNWKNEGITNSDNWYRSGTSAEAPTDADINKSLKNLKYYGAPMSDLPKFLLPNDDRGFNKVMPPSKRTAGSNKYIGVNQSAVNNGAGIQVSGKKRGYVKANADKTPHVPGEGCMPYEINGIDEGGIRSSMGYVWWTIFVVNTMLMPMIFNGNTVFQNSKISEFMGRWSKAWDIINHYDKNNYDSVAHISNKGGTGGPGPVDWFSGRDDWEADVNLWMWDVINEMAV